ncbi:hypothetical protein LZ30DRAFT_134859 [Colletotrichum cereale]|nr:hypothetical protein LZ30DRAFT_134859 [Colletotrichum cereale]
MCVYPRRTAHPATFARSFSSQVKWPCLVATAFCPCSSISEVDQCSQPKETQPPAQPSPLPRSPFHLEITSVPSLLVQDGANAHVHNKLGPKLVLPETHNRQAPPQVQRRARPKGSCSVDRASLSFWPLGSVLLCSFQPASSKIGARRLSLVASICLPPACLVLENRPPPRYEY